MLVEPRLEGGTPMISELRIPPGPVGDATAPHLEEGSTEQRDAGSRDKAEVPESFTSKELPRNNPTFTPTPPPPQLVQGSASLWCKSLLVLDLGEAGDGIGESPSVGWDTKATETCHVS